MDVSRAVQRHLPAETRMTTPGGGLVLWLELPMEIDVMRLWCPNIQAASRRCGLSELPKYPRRTTLP